MLIVLVAFLFWAASAAAVSPPAKMTYEGVLTDSTGTPVDLSAGGGTTVTFYVMSGTCVLWRESSLFTSATGDINYTIGSAAPVYSAAALNLCISSPTTLSGVEYSDGVTACNVTAGAARFLRVGMTSPVALAADIALNSVPYALLADDSGSLGGKAATSYVSVGATTATNGQLLIGNGTGFTLATLSGGSGISINNTVPGAITISSATGDATYAAKGTVQFLTDAATSGITVAAGVANVNTGILANQIVKLDATAKLPAVNASNLTALNATQLTSGTVPAAAMPALTGDVTSTAGSVATTIANNAVTDAKIASVGVNKITNAAAAYFTYKPNNVACTTNQVLSWDGTNWICASTGAGTVTNVSSSNSYLTVGTPSSTPSLTVNVGTAVNTVAAGNDTRIVNALPKDGSVPMTGPLTFQTWITGARPSSPSQGQTGFNTTTGYLETYNGSSWVDYSAGGGLAAIASNTLLANTTGGAAVPIATSLTTLLDTVSSAQGSILYRSGSSWSALAPGTAGQFLQTQAAANPVWANAGGSGTVTSVSAAATGGNPIVVGGAPTITPTIDIPAATSGQNGYLKSIDWTAFNNKLGTASAFTGDVSGTSSTTSVDKLKGIGVAAATTTGQMMIYDGASWVNSVMSGDATMPSTGVLALNTVSIAKGGTGQITQTLAFNALSPLTTKGDLLARDITNNIRFPVGTDGQVLSASSAAASGLAWITPNAGTVTSVTSANGDIGVATSTTTPVLTLNSGTGINQIVKLDGSARLPAVDGSLLTGISTSQVSGVVALANGGTGQTTAALARTALGLGSAATKNTGVVSGDIPAIGPTGITNNSICTSDGSGNIICNTNPTSYALTAGTLGQFAATTSAELAGVLNDETGSGAAVFGTSPALSGTPTATTAAVDTLTTQIATTAFVLQQASATGPVMDGTQAVGTSLRYARADHVHASDTSRAPVAGSTSITTLGTIATGTWNGTTIAVANGGTGTTTGSITGTGALTFTSGANGDVTLTPNGTGNTVLNGHIAASNAGTPAISACGTTPSITGNDTRGTFTPGTGTVLSCTITFNQTYSSTPYCVAMPKVTLAAGSVIYANATTTTLTVQIGNNAGGMGTFAFTYICLQ
jgi:hypothetical protein